MKIALVGPVYPHRGGIAHYTALLADHLRRSHEVRLYAFHRLYPDRLFPGRSQFDPSEAPLVELDARRWLTPWSPASWSRVLRDWSIWRPEVAAIQWWIPFMSPMTAWLARRAKRMGILTTLICHNVLPHERSRIDKLLVKLALRQADRLIVHSITDRDRAAELLPGCDVRLATHPSYARVASGSWTRDSARAALGEQGRMLLFFGLVRPYKGLLDLLDAMPAVLAELDVTLYVVGEIWGDAEVYHRRIVERNLHSHVNLVDRYVTNDEAAMYFAAADLVVLPYREATGSGVLQLAFGSGAPAVATRTGGMAESVEDGVTGFLVEPGDMAGLSRSIVRFFQENRADFFRENIHRRQGRFGWEQVAELMVGD